MGEDTRKLVVVLSKEDLLARGKEQSERTLKVVELEIEKSKLTNLIKPEKERILELAKIIESGEEVQEVETDWDYDWDKGIKTLYRADTGAQVGEPAAITDFDRQEKQRLFP